MKRNGKKTEHFNFESKLGTHHHLNKKRLKWWQRLLKFATGG